MTKNQKRYMDALPEWKTVGTMDYAKQSALGVINEYTSTWPLANVISTPYAATTCW